jgi:hypothetical protein
MDTLMESRRERMLGRFKRFVVRHRHPRIQMTLILTATMTAGFLCSVVLLRLGLEKIWLRYLLSICLAYLTFLILVRIWVAYHRRSRLDAGNFYYISDMSDQGNLPGDSSPGTPGNVDAGGSFQGTTGPATASDALKSTSSGASAASAGSGGSIPSVDLDEIVVIGVVIAAVGSAFVASAYLVFAAPDLLAELLLNGALGTGLYVRLKKIERRNWLETAIRKTWVVALVVVVFFVTAGLAMHSYMPQARSMGDIWRQYSPK